MKLLPPFRIGTRFKISWRYFQRHIWQGLLMVVGVALGVAVMIGVDLANESARRAFQLSTSTLTGRATHYLSSGSRGLEEDVYIGLIREGLDVPAAPLVTGYASSPQLGGLTLQVLGVDPFVEAPFRDYLTADRGGEVVELTALLTTPGGVLLSRELADQHQLELGSNLNIIYAGNLYPGTVVGLLNPGDDLSRRALNETLLMDLASAQEITGKLGLLDRVDLILPEDSGAKLQALQDRLPDGVRVLPVEARTGVIEQMTSAFQLNLTALSLLAMVVALFLIYNAMTFSVTQRRSLIGTLRSLGMTRREVFLMVVGEALVVGSLGSLLGTLLGIAMGRSTIGLVTQTVNDLFFVTTVREVPIPLISLLKGILIGLIGTAAAASFPAREAVQIPPRSALRRSSLESKARRIIPWIGRAGMGMILAGGALLLISSRSLPLSFGATFLIILGLAMLTPLVTRWIMSGISRLVSARSAVVRMAPREVVSAISRTSVAVAALMIAVSVTIGVSLMITSFRSTVVTWLDQILQGDIYISAPGASVGQPTYPLDSEVIPILENWQDVDQVALLQTAVVDSPRGPIRVSASDNPYRGLEQIYRSTAVPVSRINEQLARGAVLISEPLANRLDLSAGGDQLALYTDQGLISFPIVGIYYDYSSTQGTAILSRDVYRRYWGDSEISAASLILAPGADLEQITRDLQERLGNVQQLRIRPNQALRQETLVIFDRTFAITGTLQFMTTVVAFVGVLSAMLSLQLDKKRQIGILRALGLTGKQLWKLVLLETGLMGLVAGVLAMPTGYVLSLILIYIINKRSFGWTLLMEVPPGPFFSALLIAVGASTLAGMVPARRMLRESISEAIRFE